MKKSLLFLASAVLIMASCAKVENEEVVVEKGSRTITLKATVNDAETRVSADASGNYSWQDGESISISVNDGTGGYIDEAIQTENSGTTASFEITLDGNDQLGNYAFSPAIQEDWVDFDIDQPSFYLDANRTYIKDATYMPMLGTISQDGVVFRAVGGVLKLIVNNVPADAVALEFSANDGMAITGSFPIDNGQINAADGDGYNGVTIDFNGKRENNMVFYIPLPTGEYDGFELAFLKQSGAGYGDIDGAMWNPTVTLNVTRNKMIILPALNALKKGAEWSYTFESKQYSGNETITLNEQSWTLAGDGGYWGYDATKGQQFGSGKAPYKTLTLTSNFGQNYGVKDIVINTSGAADISATVSVSVGGVDFKCGNESSVSLTTSATEYTFTTPNGQLAAGDIVISYAQTSSKALYLKSIAVNPDISTPLEVVQLSALQDGGTKNVIVSWTGVDHAASYTVAIGDQSASIQLAPDNQYQHIFTVDSFGDYVVTVTANPESGYKASVATANVSVLDHTPRITLNTNSITDVDAQGWNAHTVEGVYTLNDFAADTDISVSVDGTVVTAASVSNGSVILTVAANTGESPRNGSFTLSISGEDFPVQVSQNGTGGGYETTYTSNVTLSTSGGTNATNATVVIGDRSYDAIKAGSSSNGGGVVKVTVPANKTVLHVHIAAWNGERPTIGLTVPSVNSISPNSLSPDSDSGLSGVGSTFTLSGDASSYYVKLTLTGPSSETRQVTFSASGNKKRFVIWGVNAE